MNVLPEFEAAWQAGKPLRIESIFPAATKPNLDSEERQLLIELIALELEYRYRDHAIRAEEVVSLPSPAPNLADYPPRFPGLGPLSAFPGELIADDYRCQRLWGTGATAVRVLARFPPERRKELKPLLAAVDKELAEEFVALKPVDPEELVPAPPPKPLEPGTVLGDFVLTEPLAVGGMGALARATHRPTGKPFVLKGVRPDLVASHEARKRFRREIRLLAKLNHPNVVAMRAFQHENSTWLVLPDLPGTDLFKLVKKSGPLPIPVACDCIRQAAKGLQHIHEAGLTHRDLHPGNLLRTDEGRVVVLDLGLARFAGPRDTASSSASQLSTYLTPEGTVLLGTAEYTSPESVAGFQYADIRADLYSLGCVLFFLLTGKPPFQSERVLDVLNHHLTTRPPDVTVFRKEVPAAIVTVLRILLAKDPGERYRIPAELVKALS